MSGSTGKARKIIETLKPHHDDNVETHSSRKLGHELSGGGVQPEFETLQNIPSGVFRNTQGEILGLGAGKNKYYRNPEYFSYHHMSFYDLNMGLRQYRNPVPKSGRKPN